MAFRDVDLSANQHGALSGRRFVRDLTHRRAGLLTVVQSHEGLGSAEQSAVALRSVEILLRQDGLVQLDRCHERRRGVHVEISVFQGRRRREKFGRWGRASCRSESR